MEDYIQLNYFPSKKRAEILYYKIFDIEISQENDLNLNPKKINIKFGFNDDLNKWRLKRNKIS